jgi:hypothetical protein
LVRPLEQFAPSLKRTDVPDEDKNAPVAQCVTDLAHFERVRAFADPRRRHTSKIHVRFSRCSLRDGVAIPRVGEDSFHARRDEVCLDE